MNQRNYGNNYQRNRNYNNQRSQETVREARENAETVQCCLEAAEYQNRTYSEEDYCEHVHELTGSTETMSECDSCHNHRFCTVSGTPIRMGNSHVHEVNFHTDSSDGHSHDFCGKTSKAIYVGNGKHVHFASESTESADGHVHRFQAASLINSPTDFKCEK